MLVLAASASFFLLLEILSQAFFIDVTLVLSSVYLDAKFNAGGVHKGSLRAGCLILSRAALNVSVLVLFCCRTTMTDTAPLTTTRVTIPTTTATAPPPRGKSLSASLDRNSDCVPSGDRLPVAGRPASLCVRFDVP